MRETAVFTYLTAVSLSVATVIFGFVKLAEGNTDAAFYGFFMGSIVSLILWALGNWIAKNH